MLTEISNILLIPFIGTTVGAALVFAIKKEVSAVFCKCLNSFAAGIMLAAAIWSLIIPSIELSEALFQSPLLSPLLGLWCGISIFLISDILLFTTNDATISANNPITALAITVHNVPEGMALGILLAAYISRIDLVPYTEILALSIGIGAQNLPEGSIVSIPLYVSGKTKRQAFLSGIASALAELLGALITLLAASLLISFMPFLMSFAAGAMIYVVISELCPEMTSGGKTKLCTIMFTVGFSLMMALDVALG